MPTNLLLNPYMDGPYIHHGAGEVAVAKHWTPLWRSNRERPPMQHDQGPLARPEYKSLARSAFPYRVEAGDHSQCWFLTHKVFDACVFQKVEVDVGAWYQMSARVQAWSSNGDDPHKSPREMYCSLGLLPIDRPEPWQLGTVYTGWDWIGAEFKTQTSYIVQAQHSEMWAVIRAWPKWKSLHNDFILDSAALVRVDGPRVDPGDPDDLPETTGHDEAYWVQMDALLDQKLAGIGGGSGFSGPYVIDGTITPAQ